jgi:hypothetical protein
VPRQTAGVATALVLLALATAAHAGFQVTVTALVYPRLAATAPAEWPAVHRAHARRIAPLVAVLYGALVLTGAWAAYAGTGGVALAVALVASAGAVLVTALRAAPLHGRLGDAGPDPALLAALLRADRARAVLAVVALAAAVAALFTS